MTHFIHPLSDVQTYKIGSDTRIWQFAVVLQGATIGSESNICSHCFIENDVVIGDRVTIKSGVQLWDGLRVGNDVFIGPNVSFSNDKFPRSKSHLERPLLTEIGDGASIGAGATILPNVRIGRKSMIGAGAVVTRSVPPYAIVSGNPARVIRYLDAHGGQVNLSEATESPRILQLIRESDVKGVKLFNMPKFRDPRGSLTVGEFSDWFPFNVERYFLVFDVPNAEVRGEHAHRVCHQFLVSTHGSLSVVADDGFVREEFVLDASDLGLYLPPMTWATQYKYTADAVLLVFASHPYDAGDYIRDYDQFLEIRRADN